MPSGKHQMELNSPIKEVWLFVSTFDNWAPLVPGYLEHHMIHDWQSTWKFKGNVGLIQKTVHL